MTEVFNMNKEEIIKLAREVGLLPDNLHPAWQTHHMAQKQKNLERFAALVAEHERKACIEIIETYRIPVGNSRSGELACEWTYRALHEIRDDIRARGEAEYKRGE
jgi:hypothetical protein